MITGGSSILRKPPNIWIECMDSDDDGYLDVPDNGIAPNVGTHPHPMKKQ